MLCSRKWGSTQRTGTDMKRHSRQPEGEAIGQIGDHVPETWAWDALMRWELKDVLSSPHLPPALEQGLWVWCVHLHSRFPPFFLAISAYKFLENLPQIPYTRLVHVTAFCFSRKTTVYTYCPINIIVPLSLTKISLFWLYIYYFTNPCRGTKFGFNRILLDFVVFPQTSDQLARKIEISEHTQG